MLGVSRIGHVTSTSIVEEKKTFEILTIYLYIKV